MISVLAPTLIVPLFAGPDAVRPPRVIDIAPSPAARLLSLHLMPQPDSRASDRALTLIGPPPARYPRRNVSAPPTVTFILLLAPPISVRTGNPVLGSTS